MKPSKKEGFYMFLSDETIVEIAIEELTKTLKEYIMPDNISMPLDTGENRNRYGWSLEDCRAYGQPYSSFCNFDVMPGVVAIGFKSPNPSLNESCYNPRIQAILNLIPDSGSSIDNKLSDLLGENNIWNRYNNYIDRIVALWPNDVISDEDQERIKTCFISTIENLESIYRLTLGRTISYPSRYIFNS